MIRRKVKMEKDVRQRIRGRGDAPLDIPAVTLLS